jgi:phage shock protein C
MTAYARTTCHRFTRDADRAKLGGVCAGIAEHFGLNLCMTRFLYVIFFFCAMPFAILTYIAIVLLVPAESTRDEFIVERVIRRTRQFRTSRRERRKARRRDRQAAEEEARQSADEEIRARAESLEERLRRIEKYVTSSRYQLDEEFRNL